MNVEKMMYNLFKDEETSDARSQESGQIQDSDDVTSEKVINVKNFYKKLLGVSILLMIFKFSRKLAESLIKVITLLMQVKKIPISKNSTTTVRGKK